MPKEVKSLDADARAVLERVGGGERLFLTGVYKGIYDPKLPRHYFAEFGGAAQKECVQADLVNALLDTRPPLLVFPSFSDSTKNTWVEASITDEGRQILADNKIEKSGS